MSLDFVEEMVRDRHNFVQFFQKKNSIRVCFTSNVEVGKSAAAE